jgi:hypothetical protein
MVDTTIVPFPSDRPLPELSQPALPSRSARSTQRFRDIRPVDPATRNVAKQWETPTPLPSDAIVPMATLRSARKSLIVVDSVVSSATTAEQSDRPRWSYGLAADG